MSRAMKLEALAQEIERLERLEKNQQKDVDEAAAELEARVDLRNKTAGLRKAVEMELVNLARGKPGPDVVTMTRGQSPPSPPVESETERLETARWRQESEDPSK